MNGDNRSGTHGYGILPSGFDSPADMSWSLYDPAKAGYELAATSRDAPVKDVPLTLQNPFDWGRSFEKNIESPYLWNKLLFDPRLLPGNGFYLKDSRDMPLSDFLQPAPMGPPEGSPFVPRPFR